MCGKADWKTEKSAKLPGFGGKYQLIQKYFFFEGEK